MQNEQILLNITMTPNGAQFVLDTLKKLPIETAGDLYLDIKSQALTQLAAMTAAAANVQIPLDPPAPSAPDVKHLDENSGHTD